MLLILGLALAGCDGGDVIVDPPLPATIFFSVDVQPIFNTHCIHCHGGAGGLELDTWAGVIAGGDHPPAVIPGDPVNSLLIRRLDGRQPPTMPADGPPLTQPEIDRIAQWILEGARDN